MYMLDDELRWKLFLVSIPNPMRKGAEGSGGREKRWKEGTNSPAMERG